MKAELVRSALEKVGDPNLLINLISRRVKQLNSGGGAGSRPLIMETAGLSASEIAMTEILESKLSWTPLEDAPAEDPVLKRKKRPV